MKALVTASEVKKTSENHETILYVAENSIITPAAKDSAKELGIKIIAGSDPSHRQENNSSCLPQVKIPSSHLDPAILSQIVKEVIVCLKQSKQPLQSIKEADPSGLRIVKGDSVVLEDFNTGNPKDNVKIKELFTRKECSTLSAGFISFEKTSYSVTTKNDEIDYVIHGDLECSVDNRNYCAQAGDILLIPAHTQITFTASNPVKLFYVS